MGTGIKVAILGFLNKKIHIVPFTGTGIKIFQQLNFSYKNVPLLKNDIC